MPMKRSLSRISGDFGTTKPASVSLCPPKNFVALWTTMSAPRSSGFWKYGDMNVLSTMRRIPCLFAISAIFRMSVTRIIGLVGVSMNSARVLSFMKSSGFSVEQSMWLNEMPFFSLILSNSRMLPPYMSDSVTMWSPGRNNSIIAEIAAIPDEKATAPAPPSKEATIFSACSLVGFCILL